MIECIILAGGFGTRLQHIVSDVPKSLAPVNDQPFLHYLLSYLEDQLVDHVVLAFGYKHELILDWLKQKAFTFKVSWVIEQEPLGTGGAIQLALQKCRQNQCFVMNGDTLFPVDLREMSQQITSETKAVIALKSMTDFDRYGTVDINKSGVITAFREKQACEKGLINGGIYLLNIPKIDIGDNPGNWSFEKDFLELEAAKGTLKAYVSNEYFIDIGVEEDYKRAQEEIK